MSRQVYNVSTGVLSVINEDLPVTPRPTSELSSNARSERNSLLSATDWSGNSDVTMSAEMTAYRQNLRDIPSQAGFPNDITWPQEPTT